MSSRPVIRKSIAMVEFINWWLKMSISVMNNYRLVIEIVDRYGWDYRLLIENDGCYGPKIDWIFRLTIAMVEKKIGVWKRSSRDWRSITSTAIWSRNSDGSEKCGKPADNSLNLTWITTFNFPPVSAWRMKIWRPAETRLRRQEKDYPKSYTTGIILYYDCYCVNNLEMVL